MAGGADHKVTGILSIEAVGKLRCVVANRPVHEIRLGKVKAAIWRKETEHGPRYSVVFGRIYRTEQGWETSTSFGRDELPLVTRVSDLVHLWIYEQNDRSEVVEEESEQEPSRRQPRETRERVRSEPF